VADQESPYLVAVDPCISIGFFSGRLVSGQDLFAQFIQCKPNVEVQFSRKPTGADSTAIMGVISGSGGTVDYVARYVNSIFVRKAKASLHSQLLALTGVTAVVPQYPMRLYLDVSTRAMKARKSNTYSPSTAEDDGYDGSGVNICIIDTGVDDGHPSLDDFDDSAGTVDPKFVAGFNACAAIPGNTDDDASPVFHGTHCAGIALGTGGGSLCGSPADSLYAGVAPGAGLVEVKVFPRTSSLTGGTSGACVRGMEWVLDNFRTHSIDVVSMSLGLARICNGTQFYDSGDSTWKKCSICPLANAMVDSGICVVVAAGNDGPDNARKLKGLGCPGTADKVITVAAMHDYNTITRSDDSLSNYSSRGPRASDGDGNSSDEQKPEVSAIGGVGSSLTKGTEAVWSCRGIAGSQFPGCSFWGISGTSMACPHVAGIAALMLDANSNLPPGKIKYIMINNCTDFGTSGWDSSYGYGLVDAYGACDDAADYSTGDNGICNWPRQEFWWEGVHLVEDWTPGGSLLGGAIVENHGPGSTSGYTLSLYHSDPTVGGWVDTFHDVFIAAISVPPLEEGETVTLDSIPVTLPGANSFGQDYWTLKAKLEAPTDPGTSKWPEEENNVAVRCNWTVNQAEWEGTPQEFYFYAENCSDEPGYMWLDVVDSLLPSGFGVDLYPAEGEMISLNPDEQTMVSMWPDLVDSGEVATVVIRAELEAGGNPPETHGGVHVTYINEPSSGLEGFDFEHLSVTAAPNPFRSQTRVTYGVRHQTEVTLCLYDVQGRLIRKLHKGVEKPGRHIALWDGRNRTGRTCSPGVYFLEIRADGQTRRVPIVHLR
jgi:serine protease AprX